MLFSALLMGVLVFAMYGALAFDMNTSVDHILKTGKSNGFDGLKNWGRMPQLYLDHF